MTSTCQGLPIPFSASGFFINLQTFVLLDISTCILWPWGFILVCWMCSHHRLCCCHKGLKQPSHPTHQVCIYIHNTMFALHVLRWLVFTLQIWTKIILAQWNFLSSPVRTMFLSSRVCTKIWDCMLIHFYLFAQHIPPFQLPSWELEHHYSLHSAITQKDSTVHLKQLFLMNGTEEVPILGNEWTTEEIH